MTDYICNPLDLPYRFQHTRDASGARSVHREGADPSVVRYRDRYFMFVSMTRGFFHSTDLVTWEYQRSDRLPAYDYAPDVRVVDDALLISASRMDGVCPFFRSVDPLADDFVEVAPGTFAFFDPSVFQDDDGRVYLYWGCSPLEPIYGVELDRGTFEPRGERVPLIAADVEAHGWEQPGESNVTPPPAEPRSEEERAILELIGGRPFIEGAWMTRHGDTYHLQYAAPQTEANTYADGVYTATSPLGPFRYGPQSPVSSKPGGFVTGAGHGSTFQDAYGNWWHAATMRISVNHPFERRVGLFPAGFDEDGALFCNQEFADWPMRMPTGPVDPRTIEPEWMLLSHRAAVTASSSAPGSDAARATDEDIRTWWVAGSRAPGEFLTVDLGTASAVSAVQVDLADDRLADLVEERADGEQTVAGYRAIDPIVRPTDIVVELSVDGATWTVMHDSRGTDAETPHLLATLAEPRLARFVRVTATALPYDAPFTVSGVRVFGRGEGTAPGTVVPDADRSDDRTAALRWAPAPGAIGYSVRYGLSSTALHHSWLLYGDCELVLRGLNAGADYWVAVDTFNTVGVTRGEAVRLPAPA